MFFKEDGVWRYYGSDSNWTEKCWLCREKVLSLRKPVKECVDCWKVEVWEQGGFAKTCSLKRKSFLNLPLGDYSVNNNVPVPETLMEVMYLLEDGLLAKITMGPIQVVRTGLPAEYPSVAIDRLLLLYANSIGERDRLLGSLKKAAALLCGEEVNFSLPVRRGCWRYDPILGPWQEWFPQDRDWEEGM